MKIAPLGWYRAFDANGKPLDGGKLYTYEAGTATPKPTYTGADGLTANPNPVILDANGYADVWLDSGGYKFILKDKNDVLVRTKDNIDGGGAGGFASQVISKSSSFSLSVNEQNNVIVCTTSLTISLLPAGIAGDGYAVVVVNNSTGDVTIDPDGAETINGVSTLVIHAGNSATIYCDGSAWFASGLSATKFADNEFRIKGSVDGTKQIAIEVDGLTTGTTRTYTAPDKDGILALIADIPVPPFAPVIGSFANLTVKNNVSTPNTQIDVTADSIIMVDNGGLSIKANTVAVTINCGTTGANGLDVGSLSATTWYAVWAIHNGTTVAGLASLSFTAPTMPTGYTYKKLIGALRTDASNVFNRFLQKGNQLRWQIQTSGNTTSYPVIASGSNSGVLTAASVVNHVPTAIARNIVGCIYTNNTTGTVTLAPNGNQSPVIASNNVAVLVSQAAGAPSVMSGFNFVLESTSVYYFSASTSAAAICHGAELNI
jgi:hypothetical protein